MASRRTEARRRLAQRGGARAAPALARGGLEADDYWTLSARPLHTLVFVTPLVLLYEIGSILYLTDLDSGTQKVIRAEKLLSQFLNVFGVVGLLVPGLAMLGVLLIWHVVSRDRWQVRPLVTLGMLLEAALWALPLLVLGAAVKRAAVLTGAAAMQVGPSMAAADVHALPWQARLTISLGAGLYEELLFRLVAIAALHFLVKDLLRLSETLARAVAILGSALAFAFYHDATVVAGAVQWSTLLFYTAAGVYFACIYLFRGFGIVVMAHALYDVIVLVLLDRGGA